MRKYQPMRRLPLQESANTRDLGGYPCKGGTTRWGVFLRSDNLRKPNEQDIQFLQDYGVRTTLDLRTDSEREKYPPYLEKVDAFSHHHISMNDHMHAIDFEGDLPGSMSGLYISLLDDSQDELLQSMQTLAAAEGATLFHCAIGKDRTGVISMLLLDLVGVDDNDIVADYKVTETYLSEWINYVKKERMEVSTTAMRSVADSMWRTLEHLRARYQTSEKYLQHIGVTDAEIEQIKTKFVDRFPAR